MFRDRQDAGRQLALALRGHCSPGAVVLGLARGGIPVAAEIARALGLGCGVMLVRKLGAPGQPELALGAVAGPEGGRLVVNPEILRDAGLAAEALGPQIAAARAEIARRRKAFAAPTGPSAGGSATAPPDARDGGGDGDGDGAPVVPASGPVTPDTATDATAAPAWGGKAVILADDGAATGASMRAAIAAARDGGAARVIVALPVAAAEAKAELAALADDLVCLRVPAVFQAVGMHYASFPQLDDADVRACLKALPPPSAQPL